MKFLSWKTYHQNHKQVQPFLGQKGNKILLQIFSVPTYFKEVNYTVSGILLIDANTRVLLYV